MNRVLLVVSVWTFLFVPLSPLWAEDMAPVDQISPKINHNPVKKIIADGNSVEMTAILTDNDAIREGLLFYRPATSVAFVKVRMEAMGNHLYRAVIPAGDIPKPDSNLEYYIAVLDKTGNVTLQGLASEPMSVSVKAPALPPVEEVVKEVMVETPPVAVVEQIVPEEKPVIVPALEGLTATSKPVAIVTPFYKKWWFWGIVAVVVGGIIVAADRDESRSGSFVVEVPSP